ncbi:hypothetical protein MMPV_003466 [Pyropia vietnamensis]
MCVVAKLHLPPGEKITASWSAALARRGALPPILQGRLVLTNSHLRFYARLLGRVTRVAIPLVGVRWVAKRSGLLPAGAIRVAVVGSTTGRAAGGGATASSDSTGSGDGGGGGGDGEDDDEYVFGSLLHRDATLRRVRAAVAAATAAAAEAAEAAAAAGATLGGGDDPTTTTTTLSAASAGSVDAAGRFAGPPCATMEECMERSRVHEVLSTTSRAVVGAAVTPLRGAVERLLPTGLGGGGEGGKGETPPRRGGGTATRREGGGGAMPPTFDANGGGDPWVPPPPSSAASSMAISRARSVATLVTDSDADAEGAADNAAPDAVRSPVATPAAAPLAGAVRAAVSAASPATTAIASFAPSATTSTPMTSTDLLSGTDGRIGAAEDTDSDSLSGSSSSSEASETGSSAAAVDAGHLFTTSSRGLVWAGTPDGAPPPSPAAPLSAGSSVTLSPVVLQLSAAAAFDALFGTPSFLYTLYTSRGKSSLAIPPNWAVPVGGTHPTRTVTYTKALTMRIGPASTRVVEEHTLSAPPGGVRVDMAMHSLDAPFGAAFRVRLAFTLTDNDCRRGGGGGGAAGSGCCTLSASVGVIFVPEKVGRLTPTGRIEKGALAGASDSAGALLEAAARWVADAAAAAAAANEAAVARRLARRSARRSARRDRLATAAHGGSRGRPAGPRHADSAVTSGDDCGRGGGGDGRGDDNGGHASDGETGGGGEEGDRGVGGVPQREGGNGAARVSPGWSRPLPDSWGAAAGAAAVAPVVPATGSAAAPHRRHARTRSSTFSWGPSGSALAATATDGGGVESGAMGGGVGSDARGGNGDSKHDGGRAHGRSNNPSVPPRRLARAARTVTGSCASPAAAVTGDGASAAGHGGWSAVTSSVAAVAGKTPSWLPRRDVAAFVAGVGVGVTGVLAAAVATGAVRLLCEAGWSVAGVLAAAVVTAAVGLLWGTDGYASVDG